MPVGSPARLFLGHFLRFQRIYINLQLISFSSFPSPSLSLLHCPSTCFHLKAGLPSQFLSLSAHISPVSEVELRPPILTPIDRKDLILLHHWHHVSQWYVPTFNCLQIACSYSLFLVYGSSKPIPLTIPFAHAGLANFPSHCRISTHNPFQLYAELPMLFKLTYFSSTQKAASILTSNATKPGPNAPPTTNQTYSPP